MGSIIVSNLGKAYKQYPNRSSRLLEWFSFGKKTKHDLKWVLKGINFSVSPGESLGIMGVNGAGKSTLLKMITGTTQPSLGSVHVTGTVAALLELGMGFHADCTGLQNVLLSGHLLGYSEDDINNLLPDIVAFADIGEYIYQPLRVYSSGMQVRLAFAIATAKRPDILIVDEALAVGDVYFQQKCYKRIKSYLEAGSSLLFVTHSMGTVLELCTRAIYLKQGHLYFDGKPKDAVDLYQADILVVQDKNSSQLTIKGDEQTQSLQALEYDSQNQEIQLGSLSTRHVVLKSVVLTNLKGDSVVVVGSGEKVNLEIRYLISRVVDDPHVGFKIRNPYGTVIFETNTFCMRGNIGKVGDGELFSSFTFSADMFPGDYTITVGMANQGYAHGLFEESLSYQHDVMKFTVLPDPDGILWAGVVNLHPKVTHNFSR